MLMGMKLQHEETADFTLGDAGVFFRAHKPSLPTPPNQGIFWTGGLHFQAVHAHGTLC